MAVNALGQTIQLLLSSTQVQDLTDGLKAGDLLRGRVVDIMPGNQAIVNFKGINLVAELKADLAQMLIKGDILNVKVASLPAQATAADATQAANNSLTLQLLQRTSPGQATENQPAPAVTPQQTPMAAPLVSRDLSALLRQVNLPQTPANLAAARALSTHGLPVTSASIRQVVDLAQQLQDQGGTGTAQGNSRATQSSPAPSIPREVLVQAKALLSMMNQQTPTVQRHIEIQQALKMLEQIAQTAPRTDESLSGNQEKASALGQETQPQTPAASLGQAVQNLAQNPQTSMNGLLQVLRDAQELIQNQFSKAPAPLPTANQGPSITVPTTAQETPSPVVQAPAPQETVPQPAVTITLENTQLQENISLAKTLPPPVLNLLVNALAEAVNPTPRQPVLPSQAATVARQLAASLQEAGNPLAQAIENLAQETAPALSGSQNSLPEPLPLAFQFLNQAADSLENLGNTGQASSTTPQVSLGSQAGLRAVLEGLGLNPGQGVNLANLSKEAVIEAVVFLQARGLPVKPAFVEPVALALTLENGPVRQMDNLNQSLAQVDGKLLQTQAELKQAIQDFQKLFDSQGVKPEAKQEVHLQLQNLLDSSGLKLESKLAAQSLAPSDRPVQAPAPDNDMKASLARLQQAVDKALAQPGLDSSSRSTLEHVSAQVQSSLSSLTAQQLANQALPSRDWVSFHVPVWFGQAVMPGQLSVYWKKGSTPQLSDQEPLNVVFNLQTRGLGPVKAYLAIYKTECLCQVRVDNAPAQQFIQDHLDELRSAFAGSTPFKLTKLDVVLDDTTSSPLFQEPSPLTSSQGVSLSA